MRTPSHTCPRYVCARVRKLLAKHGLPLARKSGRYSAYCSTQVRTEGFTVSKVGVSKSVSVHYGAEYANGYSRDLPKGKQREMLAAAQSILRANGYHIDDIGWIECDNYDEHDR